MNRSPLLRITSAGLYCEVGGFHVDPWHPVARAITTHAHADHFVAGCKQYVTAASGRKILQHRLGPRADIFPLEFGTVLDCFGVKVSLHPAGHILGSAQVRVEYRGEVWVISGDYKVAADTTCTPFEPIRCDTFVTESTFGHPYFTWDDQQTIFDRIHQWWADNQRAGQASVVYAYSLGKAQRLLAGLDPQQGPLHVHPQIDVLNGFYRGEGIALPATQVLTEDSTTQAWDQSLIVLPPRERWHMNFPWASRYQTAFVSGWMVLPDGPHQRRVQTGFALSDHADHQELLDTVAATGAENVFVTHGYLDLLTERLRSLGLNAQPLKTPRCQTPPKIPAAQRELGF